MPDFMPDDLKNKLSNLLRITGANFFNRLFENRDLVRQNAKISGTALRPRHTFIKTKQALAQLKSKLALLMPAVFRPSKIEISFIVFPSLKFWTKSFSSSFLHRA